jgi:uncharacterized protein YigA (DUF484 family)
MTNEFGKSSADPAGQDEGKNFGSNEDGTTNTDTGSQGIDPVEYEALRKRDEAAQAHIERLERENAEARDKVVELQDNLSKATTLDEALERIQNQGESQQTVDRTDVAQIVEEVLGQKQTQTTMDSNWNSVVASLTQTYGDWEAADLKVQERAKELDISIEDATRMAKQNPKAFLQLFDAQVSSNTARSSGTEGMGQRGVSSQSGDVRDKAYYSKMRREQPNKYWSVNVQAQMRRDLFNHN